MVEENSCRIVADEQAELICRFTPSYILTSVNSAYCHYFNMKEEDLLGRSMLDCFPEPERLVVKEKLMSLTGKNPVVTYRHRVKRPDGTTGWQERTDRAIFNSRGRVAAYQSIARDVSDVVSLEELLMVQRDLALELNECVNASETYTRILDVLMRIEPVDSGGIYEHDPAAKELRLVSHRGLEREQVELIKVYPEDSLQYRIIMEGHVLYRDGIQANPLPDEYRLKGGIRSLGVIPVLHRGTVVAALNIASHSADSFPPGVRAAVESIAAQMGSIIRNIGYREMIYLNSRNLMSFFNSIDDMIFILDETGAILEINDAASRKLGYSIDELGMKSVLEVHPPAMRKDAQVIVQKMLAGEEKVCTIPVQTKSGSNIPVETFIAPGIWNEKPALFGLTRDMTERIALANSLQENRERLDLAIKGGNLGTWDWNIVTGEVVFNERWAEMLGYDLSEIRPHVSTWEKLVHPDDMAAIMAELNKHLAGLIPLYRTEHRLKTKDGSWKWVLDTGRVFIRSQEGAPLRAVGVHVDINDAKNTEAMLREISIRDPLTGLYNRRYIFEQLHHVLARHRRSGESVAVAIADIDFFKKINDSLGHAAGDNILRDFSGILAGSLREYDLPGRYGGEEFIIIFDGSNSIQAADVMERIRKSVYGTDFRLKSGESVSLTFSSGIADTGDIPEDKLDSDLLVELADKRLYRAKNEGRNRVVFRDGY